MSVFAVLLGCGSSSRGPSSAPREEGAPPTFTAEQRAVLAELAPVSLPPAPPDVSNRWADDAAAASFGQKLFFDPSFSGTLLDGDNDGSAEALGQQGDTAKVACSSCHVAASAFTDTRTIRRQISLAAGWGRRRAPSLLDVAHSRLLMWDGQRDSLQSQIFSVIESPVEMNSSRLFAAKQIFLLHREDYEAIFGVLPPLDDESRFPPLSAAETGCSKLDSKNRCVHPMRGAPGDGAEFDGMTVPDQEAVTRVIVNVGKAMGAYQRLLSCGPGRFDAWVNGDSTALSNGEQRGAELFIGRGRCVECHSGPHLSDDEFHNVGLKAELVATTFFNPNDRGAAEGFPLVMSDPLNVRGAFSDGDDGRLPADSGAAFEGAFKTPRLRCVSQRPSFMHTGQMLTLADVIAFFDSGGDVGGFPGKKEVHELELSSRDEADLVAFLRALDGPGPAAELLQP
jgi:cytochrome c peroxidase